MVPELLPFALFCIQLRAVLLFSPNLTPSNLTCDCNAFFTACMSCVSILADINSKRGIESSERGDSSLLAVLILHEPHHPSCATRSKPWHNRPSCWHLRAHVHSTLLHPLPLSHKNTCSFLSLTDVRKPKVTQVREIVF